MKTVLFWMLRRLGIPAGFMLATGMPQTMYHSSQHQSKSPVTQFTPSELATLEITPENFFHYTDSLKQVREYEVDKKGIYAPSVYFRDLKQLSMFKEKYYEAFNENRNQRDMIIEASRTIGNLAGLRSENWRHVLVDRKQISEAHWYWFPKEKQRDLESAKFAAQITWASTTIWFMGWLFRFYLQGLPVAFILFLIWKITLKKDFDEEFKWTQEKEKPQMYFGIAPLSFLISLLMWPIVLGIDIHNKFEETLRRADVVSRRGKLLSLFSKQEERLFELGKKMTQAEFREHLDSIGMIQKHSFASALLVTLFLIIIPASLFPQKTTTHISKEKVIIMKSDYGGGGIHYDVFAKSSAMLNYGEDVKQFPEFTKRIFFIIECLYEYMFSADVGKVPLVINRVSLISIL